MRVQRTAEFRRIVGLPRRSWSPTDAAEAVQVLTAALRTPGGTMRLRETQAIGLAEAGAYGGAYIAAGVGAGKTLISALVPTVLGASRPLLIVPANLIDKTERAFDDLRRDWQVPDIRIVSYQLLGHPYHADLLEEHAPDLVCCDEGHCLKDPTAAVTRRLKRYLCAHPDCRFVCMTGTVSKHSITDYAHLVQWCLGWRNAPVPVGRELEEWAAALDARPHSIGFVHPGALLTLRGPEEDGLDDLTAARRVYRRRLVETPGFVATTEDALGCSLIIQSFRPPVGRAVLDALTRLRETWETPDGFPLFDGMRVWAVARQLGLGFFYRWEPAAPRVWMAARRAWASECRHILTTNRRNLDSEAPVKAAVREGLYPRAERALEEWEAVEPTFVPNKVAVWLDDSVLRACNDWAKRDPGIVWTEHTAFAERLAELTGLRYYGREGRDADGNPIPELGDARCGRGVVIASMANRTGRNLQGWSRNLITSPPANGEWWEQLLGRTHRPLQEADTVTADVMVTCREHAAAFWKAKELAKYLEDTLGQAQKLGYADVSMPREEEVDG